MPGDNQDQGTVSPPPFNAILLHEFDVHLSFMSFQLVFCRVCILLMVTEKKNDIILGCLGTLPVMILGSLDLSLHTAVG